MSPRERRIGLRLHARGDESLFAALLGLRGRRLNDRLRLGRVRAVGGEGAIFDVPDAANPAVKLVGKIARVRWQDPIEVTSAGIRRARAVVRTEGELLRSAASQFLPACVGLFDFTNPLLERARGGAFREPEPCLVMERIQGADLDAWLCRVHRGHVDRSTLRPSLDRITVGLVQALAELEARGYLYADLRTGNFRVVGRPRREVRLLDAGSLVRIDDEDARFPHVPSYLPPQLYRAAERGERLRPTPATQAFMAGRALYEVATGTVPQTASCVDFKRLLRAPVSPPVGEVIAALADGEIETTTAALDALIARSNHGKRRGGS